MKAKWKNFSLEDRQVIREVYQMVWDDLLKGSRIDPYSLWPHDWTSYMSPIEVNMWSDIRSYGLFFYPQVPIGNFFVDFANPLEKIVIEVDGKQWHDIEKDALRDKELKEMGWRVVRLPGSETFWEEIEHNDDDDKGSELPRWFEYLDGLDRGTIWL